MSTASSRANEAAILIDADNISDAATIERGLAHMQEQGWRLTVRRAYGGHEKLSGLKDCLLRHGIRALVNQGKGTTDALLCVDVMDLFHAAELPDIVAVASSDADFAPLAVRLREAGIRVICFAQRAKAAGEELAKVYEQVVYLDDVPAPAAPRPARKAAAKRVARPKPPEPQDPVRAALGSIPGFEDGGWVAMNEVVKRLRADDLLSKSGTGPRFLAKNAPYVELAPASQPNKVRLKASAR
ncbi:NYN domain-containing protein [Ramlibacter montanisoli]|uniref:NYN domain-containing protein n=1 Tax=Ramlibacter montanisoli TaxID=2732512 RepID=A0A849KHI0_9BURK|nr:NYN domain-containing protein [Ramlibacter montanisoli]NNU44081.1 NYN domain-containing protein [Ramlibacter montanisoli]